MPLEHLAEYTDALTEVFARHGTRGTWYAHASVGTLHVRPILDMRRDGAAKMRAIAEEASALVRKYKGAYSGEHGDGLCRGEWIAWQFGPAHRRRLSRHQAAARSDRPVQPGQASSIRRRWTTARCFASLRRRPAYRTIALKPVLDWSAWNVQNDPRHRADHGAGQRRRRHRRLRQGRRDVQQQRPLPQVRRRHDVPELSRHARRAAPDARPRQHAAPGAVGPARRADALTSDAVHDALDLCVGCKGCKRDCPTGVDMARMKIEFLAHYKARHGHTLQDRLIAAPARLRRLAEPRARGWPTCATACPALARLGERWLGLSARRSLPRWRARHVLAPRRRRRCRPRRRDAGRCAAAARPRCSSSTPSTAPSRARTRVAAARVLQAAGYAVHVAEKRGGGTSAAAAPISPPAWSSEAQGQGARADRRAAAVRRARHRHRRPRAVVPADAARRDARDGARRRGRARSRRRRCCSRNSSPAKRAPAASHVALQAGRPADPRARPLPPEGVRRRDADRSRCCA